LKDANTNSQDVQMRAHEEVALSKLDNASLDIAQKKLNFGDVICTFQESLKSHQEKRAIPCSEI